MFVAPMLKMGRNARKAIAASGATLAASQSEDADAGLTGIFSQAVKAAKKLDRSKPANAQAFFNDLKKLGVKDEELHDMKFLDSFGNRNDVTTEEAQQFIYDNNILNDMDTYHYGYRYGDDESAPHARWTLNRDLTDETYGAQVTTAPNPLYDLMAKREKQFYATANRWQKNVGKEEVQRRMKALMDENDEMRENIKQVANEKAAQLRDIPEDEPFALRAEGLHREIDDLKHEYRKYRNQGTLLGANSFLEVQDMSPKVLGMLDADLGQLAYKLQDAKERRDSYNFKNDAHWDEENPIVTQRFSEKLSTTHKENGLPHSATVIEEIQGDMHQKGNQYEYMTPELERELDLEERETHKKLKELRGKTDSIKGSTVYQNDHYEARTGVASDDTLDRLEQTEKDLYDALAEEAVLEERVDDIEKIQRNSPHSDLAPMKKSWEMLGVKQALIDAVERGDQRLFLTSPESQIQRYAPFIRKFDRVDVYKKPDGKGWALQASLDGDFDKSFEAESATFEGLRKHIGKDAYEDIVRERQQTGLDDFEVTGDYMTNHESFHHMYGRVLPKKINALGKPYGVKLEPDTVHDLDSFRTYDGSSMRITKEMADDIRENGLPLYSHPAVGAVTLAGGAALGSGALVDMPSAEMPKYTSLYDDSVSVGNTMGQELSQQKANMSEQELSDYNFNNLMAEEARMRELGSLSYGKASPELMAYRRRNILPSLEEVGNQIKLNAASYLDAISSGDMSYTGLPDYEFSKVQGVLDELPSYRDATVRKAVEPMLKEYIDPRDKRSLKDAKNIANMIF